MRFIVLSLLVVLMAVASVAAMNCSTCHKGELAGAAMGNVHGVQVQGLQDMQNPMHGALRACTSCHATDNLAAAASAGESLLGGSLEALGTAPACAGCHNQGGVPGPYWTNWDMKRVQGHTFTIPK
ncbi:hypothetical protein LGV61_12340 [Desulfurispirillum indicum]|uniref:multiheme c-type cytochrome n=1 Tax=Desulfurispirillum indicum TaxID=936456 RepID=UPI001CF95581|nr:cytochrome c3 family protein [Desulfurispirillum indicum]UCZ56502.1 hypothetical protein LGV61_12340 [Desulfurispirillum indicum]